MYVVCVACPSALRRYTLSIDVGLCFVLVDGAGVTVGCW